MGGNTKKARGRIKNAVRIRRPAFGAITGDRRLQREGKRDEHTDSLANKTGEGERQLPISQVS